MESHHERLWRKGSNVLKPRWVPILLLGASLIVLAAVAWVVRLDRPPTSPGRETLPEATAQIRGRTFYLDVAASSSAREIGLSNTDTLPEDRGMLFLYDQPDYYQFWMKGMTFPIDIVFIRESTVVFIASSVPPPIGDSELPRYGPDEPVDKVLEINAGLCDKYGIQAGDAVEIAFLNPKH